MAFTLTAQIKLQNPDNIGQFINQLRNQIGRVNVNVNVAGGNKLNTLNKSLTNVSANAKTAANSITGFGEQAALAAKRFFAFSIATNGFLKLIGAIQRGAVDAIAFEKEIYKIAQVTGSAVRDLRDLTSEVTTLSTSLGVTSGKILNAAQVLAQAGLSADDTKIALGALAKTELSATFDDISNTTEGAIAIFSQFGVKATQLEGKLGSINAVAGKFAVESSDLVTAVRRTGGAFQAAGGSLEELISLFTSVRATTRESAESIATGFRTIFTRLQRTKTVTFLEDIGVQLRDFEGQFVGPYEAIRRLSAVLKEIPSTDPRFAQVIEELGGFRQVSKVIPLIQKFSEAEKALVVAQQGQGSLAKDAAQAQGSLANQLAKVREEFDALLRKIANNDAFKGLVQVTTQLATALIKVADAATPLLPFISIIAALKVNKVAPAFFSGFVAKKGLGFNQGGEVPAMKFARGGLVPGTGNTDTVRANLTPGEFVVRKDAVKAIGVNNLHNLQNRKKFQLGGRVEDIDDDDIPTILNIFKENPMRGNENTDTYVKRIIKDKKIKIINSDIDPRGAALFADAATKRRGISADSIREAVANRKSTIKNKDDKQNNKDAKEFAKNLLPQEDRTFGAIFLRPTGTSGDFDTSINGTLIGGQFDGVSAPIPIHYKQASMTNASAKAFEKTVDTQLPDVVNALAGNIARNFGSDVLRSSPTRLNRIPGRSAVMGWLFEGALQSLGAPYQEDADDNKTFDFPGGLGKLSNIFPLSSIKKRPVDAKLTKTDSNDQSLRDKAKSWLTPQLSKVMKFAIGGQAKGTDTVPAVLTPGEFVFTKEAAQGIGYDNLHKLNKAKGYAKGGVVTGYASGGTVSSSSGTSGLFSGTGGIIALAVGIQTLSQQFGTLSKEMQSTIGAVTGIGTNFIIFKGLLDQINPKWNGLSKTSGELSERYKNISSRLTNRKDDLDAKYKSLSSRYVANLQKISVEEAKNVDRLNNLRRQGINLTALATNPKQLKQDLAANPLYNAGNSGTARNAALRNKALNTSIDEVLRLPAKRRALTNENRSIQFESLGISAKLNNIPQIQQNQKNRYNKKILNAQRLEIGTNAALVAAGSASALGGIASEYGASNIRAGGTSTAMSGLGGGLQGAATGAIMGAAIGSLIAPGIGTAVGAALGGVGGAIAGTVTALQEANNQIAAVKFEATFKEFQRKILEGGDNISTINEFGRKASSTLQSTSGDDRVTAIGQIESASITIDATIKKTMFNVAKNGNNAAQVLADFKNNVDPQLLEVFAISTGRTLTQLEHDLKKSADSAVKMANSHLKAVTAIERVADRMNYLANVTAGLATTQQLLDESSSRVSLAESGKFSLQPSRATAYLNNPQSFSKNNHIVKNEITDALSMFGTSNSNLLSNFNAGSDVIDKVRTVLGGVKSKGTIENASEVAIDSFGQIPDILKQGIINSLKEFESTSDQPAKFANELETNFEGVVAKVTESLKSLAGFDVIKQSIELNIKAFNSHLDIINKINDIQRQNIELSLQGISVQESYFDTLKELKISNPNATNANRDTQRQAVIFNNPNLINNARGAGQQARYAQTALEREQNQANPDVNIVQAMNDKLTAATNGLKYLADYSARAAGPLKKIAEIRAKKQEASGFVDSTFGGGVSSVRDTFKQLTLLNQATTGGIQNISSQDQVGLLKFLEQSPEASAAALGGQEKLEAFTTSIRKNLLANSPLNSLTGQNTASGRFLDATKTNLNATISQQLTELQAIHASSEQAVKELQALNNQKIVSINQERKQADLAKASGDINVAQNKLKQEEEKLAGAKTAKATAQQKYAALQEIERLAGIDQTLPEDIKAQRLAEVRSKDFSNSKTSIQLNKEKDIATKVLDEYSFNRVKETPRVIEAQAAIAQTNREVIARKFGYTGSLKTFNELGGDEGLNKLKDEYLKKFFGESAAKLISKDINISSLSGTQENGKYNTSYIATAILAKGKELLTQKRNMIDIDPRFDEAIINQQQIKQQNLILSNTDTKESVTKDYIAAENQRKEYEISVREATSAFNIATNNLAILTQTMKDYPIPSQIHFDGTHNVQVQINGAQVLTQIMPGIQGIVTQSIQTAFDRFVNINGGRLRNIGP